MAGRDDDDIQLNCAAAGDGRDRLCRPMPARSEEENETCDSAGLTPLRPLDTMRANACFILLTLGFALQAAPSTTNAVLAAPKHSAAEAVYRSFFPGSQWRESRTNLVYCLSFGTSDLPLSSDFMARFQAPSHRVITGTNGFVSGPGSRVEHATGREVVILALRSLSIQGERAEARVLYCAPSTVITETLHLTLKYGQWRVTKRKQESIACF